MDRHERNAKIARNRHGACGGDSPYDLEADRSPKAFVLLKPGANPAAVEKKITHFLDTYLTTREGAGFHLELGLQPFGDMYLHGTFKNGYPEGGRIQYVRLFTIVAIFILTIACINFMNLSTARSVKRAKEVGIRKTIGAGRLGRTKIGSVRGACSKQQRADSFFVR